MGARQQPRHSFAFAAGAPRARPPSCLQAGRRIPEFFVGLRLWFRHSDEVFRNSSEDRAGLIHYTASHSLMRVLVVEDERKVADALRATTPRQLDFVHANGTVWEAIYSADRDVFRLNYVEVDGRNKRPTLFATSSDTAGTVIVMRRTAQP